ncbi:MAG TPA: acyl-CoA dehydrogenase family protein [Ilumatobacter sp.]|nr:acyl-CoA dehydrogenase family protein [Ilumatobacter sp.]
MTTIESLTDPSAGVGDASSDLLQTANGCGAFLAERAAQHDRDGSWVAESFDHVKSAGLLAIGVPKELGGMGATISEIAMVQRELAKHCGSTALASSMHQHVTAFTAWRYRRGLPGAEGALRKVLDDGIVLVSTGGGDATRPHGTAVKADGGYTVSGHKRFVSQSPIGTVMSTMFRYEDPELGTRVLNMSVPMSSPGIFVDANWDTLGMRGTASNDVVLDNVFVPDERVLANRPHDQLDGPLQVIFSIALPIIAAVYLGIAEGARDYAVAHVSNPDDAITQRNVGLMNNRLLVAGWALEGALRTVGDDPQPSMETVAASMAAKREIGLAGLEVCDLAMEVTGGRGFFRGSPIERAYRDIRAIKFHPMSFDATLVHSGRLALGVPCDRI